MQRAEGHPHRNPKAARQRKDTAGMIGIPRDLLMPIAMPAKDCQYLPDGNPYAQDRINTAYFYGDLCKYRGGGGSGGPGLAKDTVQYNFGVKVHY